MPPLSRRGGPRLLTKVGGKSHATQADHQEPLPARPTSTRTSSAHPGKDTTSHEDIYRDPISSDDEAVSDSEPLDGPAHSKYIDGAADEIPSTAGFKQPACTTSSGSKRSLEDDLASSDNDRIIFSSQGSAKRFKTSTSVNIHAPPRRKEKGYGGRRSQSSQKSNKESQLQAPKTLGSKKDSASLAPIFKKAAGGDVFEFGTEMPKAAFRAAGTSRTSADKENNSANSLSPSLSSLSSPPSSPEVQEIQSFNLPRPQPYVSKTDCAICGAQVESSVKEEFEDRYNKGQPILSYKWQQRFCRHHRELEAAQSWQQRGYPTIDWNQIQGRMRRHESHLLDVLRGAKQSYYRTLLKESLSGRSRTALQLLNSDSSKRRTAVGYYGPRGEKVMTDHIISRLSDKLRDQAARDRLVAAAGVSGGVSGFVQAVLVPELAEQLITEDSKVSTDEARSILEESADLGNLLHPDVVEKADSPTCEMEKY